MAQDSTLLILAGDGIGPEVMAATEVVIEALRTKAGFNVTITHDLVGGAAIDAHGVPVTDAVVEQAKRVDAVLLGAVGGPKWDALPTDVRPEKGLLRLRKDLDVFANLRPAFVFPSLVGASSLKPDLVSGLDLLIVRELTSGVYFGEPRGIHTTPTGEKIAINTQSYTEGEIARVVDVAFDAARGRGKRLCVVDKANVMETGVLWREVAHRVHQNGHQDIDLSFMYADNCAMQLVRQPKQFDVIVTDNLFGDLLSDCAAMLTGSLGMLPSASLGAKTNDRQMALYEPVHGSAPDIAGQNKANPMATILSFSMALRYSFHRPDLADRVDHAVASTLAEGYVTADLTLEVPPKAVLGTREMAKKIADAL
jgi:3-isopropylmalate dehydrogenase